MISIGGALTIAGIALAASDDGRIYLNGGANTYKDKTAIEATFLVAGLAGMLGSIGFFISAHKNKKKALSLSFKNEQSSQLQKSMVLYRSVPSLTLKINL